MLLKNTCFLLMGLLMVTAAAHAQGRRIDTTMKYGTSGYKVYTNNKSGEKNSVTISMIGFANTAQRDASFEIKGVLKSAAVDDFNNDGFPDLLLYIFNGKDRSYGTVIGVASEKNESIRPIYFPDILDDAKLRTGYKGKDDYMLIEGTIMRGFPVYDVSDTAKIKPTGAVRHIQYRMVTTEGGGYKFKVLRTYETKL